MLRFQLLSGETIAIDPAKVGVVMEGETVLVVKNKSLLSGNGQDRRVLTADIQVGNQMYRVEDPNRTVARQIQQYKENSCG